VSEVFIFCHEDTKAQRNTGNSIKASCLCVFVAIYFRILHSPWMIE